eukprot:GGOE01011287.1.p1 GENE.GGOE01011287.1~~GGOE01011287.1.p1  ORF type:complete len:226 (-),score=2.04 GGOE01011287.1:396-1073(-)
MQCTFIITALFFLLLLPPSSSTGTVIGALYSHPADDLPSSLPAPCPHLDPVALQPSLAESPMRACGARKQPAVSSPALCCLFAGCLPPQSTPSGPSNLECFASLVTSEHRVYSVSSSSKGIIKCPTTTGAHLLQCESTPADGPEPPLGPPGLTAFRRNVYPIWATFPSTSSRPTVKGLPFPALWQTLCQQGYFYSVPSTPRAIPPPHLPTRTLNWLHFMKPGRQP